EFVKFLASPEQQAFWHISTGYFPIRRAAYDQPSDKEWLAKYPQFKTAIDQLHAAPDGRPEQGAVIGVFPQSRQAVEDAIDGATKQVTGAIQQYNKTARLS